MRDLWFDVEMAVMRALGFQPSRIIALTVSESMMIGLAGGIAGCGTAYAIAKFLPASVLPLGPIDLFSIIPLGVLARAMVLALLIGLFAGAIPALSFVRRGIVDGLRAVG